MVLGVDTFDRKRKLLEESQVLIERLKKLRGLNADPRLVGINPSLFGAERDTVLVKRKRRHL